MLSTYNESSSVSKYQLFPVSYFNEIQVFFFHETPTSINSLKMWTDVNENVSKEPEIAPESHRDLKTTTLV